MTASFSTTPPVKTSISSSAMNNASNIMSSGEPSRAREKNKVRNRKCPKPASSVRYGSIPNKAAYCIVDYPKYTSISNIFH